MIRSIFIGVVAALLAAIASRFMGNFFSELFVAALIGAVVGLGGTFAYRSKQDNKHTDV